MKQLAVFFFLLSLTGCSESAPEPDTRRASLERPSKFNADVVVYSGTPGGIAAAVAAKRSGKSVILLEPTEHVGGIISGGLGMTDRCNHHGIGATSREFFHRIGKHYGRDLRWNFEPHVGERVFVEILAESGVPVHFTERLKAVTKTGTRVKSILSESGSEFKARIFIDASYEGDLLAAAGVSYALGREGRNVYGEALAGVLEFSKGRQFLSPVSAYDDDGKLLPGVQTAALEPVGTGDKKLMSYNFRLCMTRTESNRRPLEKPGNYDVAEFELLGRYFQARPEQRLRDILLLHKVTKEKVCVNRNGPFSTNLIGGSWDWPEADYAKREEIFQRHKDYTLGLLYFLNTDERVPEQIRSDISQWGLCKDEFQSNDNFPYQLYVREGRRMIGEYVLTENDLLQNRLKPDSIGIATCPIEIHEVQRAAKADRTVATEGYTFFKVEPYAIPYRSVTPKRSETDNLLVPVAVSASHVAYSSLRMEPVFMILGHSAGVAAALAVDHDQPVQDVDISTLQALLRSHSQVL